ncbi:MAG: serine/threonine-protein kinase, partial [Verrucomicrobia bacterium]|nr:serine/threonine-protein kinase [Verrucomicrobiota bacterium]
MSLNQVQSNPFQQYWMNQFKEGESLDDLTDRLQKLFDKTAEKQFHGHDSNTHSWFERTINQAIDAKKAYYSDTATGQISSVFQGIAKTFFGCGGYMTPLERAEAFAQMVSQSNPIEHLNPEVDKELNPAVPGEFKLTQTSLLDASLFFELHKEQMLDLASSENKGLCLNVPGEENASFYVFPNGHCYLVSTTKGRGGNCIGTGASKEVYRAYDLVNKKVVACMTSKTEALGDELSIEEIAQNRSLVINDYKALKQFDGQRGILQVRDGFVQNGSAIFFSDYYNEGNLLQFMTREGGNLTPEQKLHLMTQILQGMQVVHKMGYLHRDLKDANILIRRVEGKQEGDKDLYEAVIIDFDRCCKADDQSAREEVAASKKYWPPEYAKIIVQNEEVPVKHPDIAEVTTDKMDVWALGIVLFEMHYGSDKFPWNGMPQSAMPEKISKLEEDWFKDLFKVGADDAMGLVIQQMLQVDPAKRISLADAISQLQPKR